MFEAQIVGLFCFAQPCAYTCEENFRDLLRQFDVVCRFFIGTFDESPSLLNDLFCAAWSNLSSYIGFWYKDLVIRVLPIYSMITQLISACRSARSAVSIPLQPAALLGFNTPRCARGARAERRAQRGVKRTSDARARCARAQSRAAAHRPPMRMRAAAACAPRGTTRATPRCAARPDPTRPDAPSAQPAPPPFCPPRPAHAPPPPLTSSASLAT